MRLGGAFPRQAMARPFLGTAYLAEQAMGVRGSDQHPLRARVLAEAAWAATTRGDDSTADRLLHASIEAQRNGARYSAAAYSYLLQRTGWFETRGEGYDIAKEGLAHAEAAGDVLGGIGSRIAFAVEAMLQEYEDEALQQAQRALADARRLRQPTLEAAALYANGMALINADPARAITLLRETVELTQLLEIESEHVFALAMLSALEAHHGDARRGLEAFREQLASRTLPSAHLGIDVYIGVEVFNRVGRPDLVARCEGWSRHVRRYRPPFYARFYEGAVQKARATLGEKAFDEHVAEGASIAPEQFREMMLREIDRLLDTPPTR
jgi:hypothetical protein